MVDSTTLVSFSIFLSCTEEKIHTMKIPISLSRFFTALAMIAIPSTLVFTAIANATPAKFTLTNKTDVVITRLDVETIKGDDWATLETGTFKPGDTVKITIDDNRPDCNYHFRVYYLDDGKSYYKDYENVNVCNNPHWTLP
jgi:hypothetical protein